MSGIIHKAKDALHHGSTESTTTHATTTSGDQTGVHEGSAGPHDQNIANKVDPLVDSATFGSNTTTGYGNTGTGLNTGPDYGSTTAGRLDSNIANKVDPRVDSTTRAHIIGSNTGAGYGTAGPTYGTGGQTGFPGGPSQSTNAGPHDSNMVNKIDPRVDSDLDGRGQRHVAGGTHATPGSGSAQNTAGPHNSDVLNKLDPRVDSNRDGSSTIGSDRTNS
jgi:hypothetical protein